MTTLHKTVTSLLCRYMEHDLCVGIASNDSQGVKIKRDSFDSESNDEPFSKVSIKHGLIYETKVKFPRQKISLI